MCDPSAHAVVARAYATAALQATSPPWELGRATRTRPRPGAQTRTLNAVLLHWLLGVETL